MIKLKLCRLFLMLNILLLSACDIKSSNDYHREANIQEQKGKFKEAIALLSKAIEKDPQNIKALLDRGVDQSIIGNYKSAIEDYSRIIVLDPPNGLAYLNRGKNKIRLRDYKGAIEDFNRAITIKGGEVFYMNKVDNSILDTRPEFDVTMEEIRFERGIAYYNIDSLQKSFSDFSFSIEKNYSLPDCYYRRGLIYLSYSLKSKACGDWVKARELGYTEAQKLIDEHCK